MGPLDNLLSRALPEKLYHYTSQAGLLGIVRDRAIWASKITFLNDTTELHLALKLAHKAVSAASRDRRIRNALLEDLDLMKSGSINIFVCSLSTHEDQLSQWRGYTQPGDGYSIGFESAPLKTRAAAAGFTLGPCSYEPSEHLAIITETVNSAVNSAKRLTSPPSPVSLLSISNTFRDALYFAAPFLKHQTYVEEAEWRLVSSPVNFNNPGIKYRAGRSHFVPYFELRLAEPSDRLPIAHVVVGPTPQPRLALDAVEDLFTSSGLTPCDFSGSEIPFRRW